MDFARKRNTTSGVRLQPLEREPASNKIKEKMKQKKGNKSAKEIGIRRLQLDKLRHPESIDHEYLADIDDFDDQSSNDEGFGSAIDSSGGFTNVSDSFLFLSKLPTMFEDSEENEKLRSDKDENFYKIWGYQDDALKFEVNFGLNMNSRINNLNYY